MNNARELAEFITADSEYPLSTDMVEDYMREFVKEKCKQQRKICAEAGFDTSTGEYTFEDIQNAPKPI